MKAIVLKTTDEQRAVEMKGVVSGPFARNLIEDVEALLAGVSELDQICKAQVKRIDSLNDQLRDIWAGHPMDLAPKDRPILAWCVHEADPYHIDERHLTTYGAHAEGARHAENGFHILEWGGGFDDRTHEDPGYGAHVPDWWFVSGSEWEVVASPTRWWKLPPREAA